MKGEPLQLIEQQIQRWALERKAALRAATTEKDKGTAVRPILTVARQLGSGGTELAELLAARLGYQLFDWEIIDAVAQEAGVNKHLVEALDEQGRSAIEQWVDGVLHNRIFISEDFVRSLGRAFITISRAGSAVVLGRGANFFLEGETGFHIRIAAKFEYRVNRIMRIHEISRKEATTKVEHSDKERSEFVAKYLHREIEDPSAYHLVLNMPELGLDRSADLVQDVYRSVFPEKRL